MPQYVEVSINLSQVTGTFHYHVPGELAGLIQPGCLVVVPFGRQTVQGVVLDFVAVPEVAETLAVESVVDGEPVLTPMQMALAKWLADAMLAPLGACMGLMIPAGLSQKADILVQPAEGSLSLEGLPELQKRLLATLRKRGPLRGSQLEAAFRHVSWRGSLAALKREGLVHTGSVLPPARVSPKTIRTAQLAIPPDRVDDPDLDLGKAAGVIERRRKVLQLLAAEPLPTDFSWIYAQTGASYTDLKKLADDGLILFNETEVWRNPLEAFEMPPAEPPELTDDQQGVWAEIQCTLRTQPQGKTQKPILLHGVTGSGKTEVYMRAVAEVLEAGRQAIVLVPEIALTPQIVRRFLARFPNQVGIYHSKLSEGERYDTWRRARSGDLKVVIGARSALFMPMPDLGLIVMDECDHESYDQGDLVPFYHGVETAEAYARLAGAMLLMGSATPRITQYYKAQRGEWKLLAMPQRVLAYRDIVSQAHPSQGSELSSPGLTYHELPQVSVVDMRQELKAGNRSAFSRELQSALRETLAKGEQTILFLNRKGTATYVFCRECGYVLRCPRDDRPLTYHGSRSALVCHTCAYSRKMPANCPQCGGNQIRQFGMGTEKLEEMVRELLPQARTLRWDADTTSKKGAHDLILSHFSAHRADILIGTQMLAKGLDLPLVTLAGVVLAEIGLTLPDYRAAERTFQLLTQVAGRAGRSPLGGRVILQTYMPGNYAIQAASMHDFNGFYAQELRWRRELGYPPFKRLIKLEFQHQDAQRCESHCREMAGMLQDWIDEAGMQRTDLLGPVPCFFNRLGGLYRWQIILRGPDPTPLLRGRVFRDWIVEVDPPNLL
jgi:primosomal protein N' (replication factor Y)